MTEEEVGKLYQERLKEYKEGKFKVGLRVKVVRGHLGTYHAFKPHYGKFGTIVNLREPSSRDDEWVNVEMDECGSRIYTTFDEVMVMENSVNPFAREMEGLTRVE